MVLAVDRETLSTQGENTFITLLLFIMTHVFTVPSYGLQENRRNKYIIGIFILEQKHAV